jgi:tetratricopeptide (TPR) repeat protein
MATTVELYKEAETLKNAGQYAEAAAKLNEVLAIDANHALAHAAMSVVEQKLGNHAQAVAHAEKLCELEPNDSFNFAALSVTYQRAYAGTGDTSFIQKAELAMEKSRMTQR